MSHKTKVAITAYERYQAHKRNDEAPCDDCLTAIVTAYPKGRNAALVRDHWRRVRLLGLHREQEIAW